VEGLAERRKPLKIWLCATRMAIVEAGDVCQKDCGDCLRKSLIRRTAVAELFLGQKDILLRQRSWVKRGAFHGHMESNRRWPLTVKFQAKRGCNLWARATY
jgi:hypothetical protein